MPLVDDTEVFQRGECEECSGLRLAHQENLHAVRVVIGQRTEEDGIGNTEYGGVRADTQGEREDRGHCKDRAAAELPYGVAAVSHRCFERNEPGAVPPGFLGGFDASEPDQRLPPRLLRVHPIAQSIVDM